MLSRPTLVGDLHLEDVYRLGFLVENSPFDLFSWDAAEASFKALMTVIESGSQTIYGLHTHYGFNVKDSVTAKDFSKHQLDLLNYLKVGTGKALPKNVVRRALRLQVLKGLQGQSGVHPETLKQLAELSGAHDLPVVPCLGSLGASGDLIPMAHAVAPIFRTGLVRGPRDVIGLLNTNSMMVSFATELFWQVKEILASYQSLLPDLLLATGASRQAFDERLFSSRRPHHNTKLLLQRINERSQQAPRVKIDYGDRPVQNRYSFRVVPVLLDTFHKQLDFSGDLLLEESLAVADNPILFQNESGSADVIHGGLFYTSNIAVALDTLNDVLCKLAELMDRQILNLMDSSLSGQLPENLFYQDQSHCKGIHQLTSAQLQRVRTLCTPTKLMSFSCESNNQDIVPCSMTAANQLNDLVGLTTQMVRGFAFTTLRAKCIRLGADLPGELRVENWAHFDQKNFNKFQQKTTNFGGSLNQGEKDELCTK